jgi:hypothetical protein
MAQLLKQTFVKRADSEQEADNIVYEHKAMNDGEISYKVNHKVKKQKGEVIDEWWEVTVTHDYTAG